MVLQLLAEREKTLRELFDGYPPVTMLKTKIDQATPPPVDVLERKLAAWGGEVDTQDGVRWRRDREWVHVRPSNTEPIVRIIAEAATSARAAELVAAARALLTG